MNTEENICVLKGALKVIRARITSCYDIIDYLLEEESLRNSILDFYGDLDQRFQCEVALLLVDDVGIQEQARKILEQMDSASNHSLNWFFSQLFGRVFPCSISLLNLEFSTFKQGSLSFSEYGLRFKVLCERLGLELQYQKIRFIQGMTTKRIRDVLLKADLNRYDIQGLIEYAAVLENVAMIDDQGENKTSGVSTIAVSTNYFRLAEQKGLRKGLCFNCLIGHHACVSCPSYLCKFCKKPNGQVKHFSLACEKCPARLS